MQAQLKLLNYGRYDLDKDYRIILTLSKLYIGTIHNILKNKQKAEP